MQSLAARIAAAAAAALAAALTDLEHRQAAAPVPNQTMGKLPPNQAMAFGSPPNQAPATMPPNLAPMSVPLNQAHSDVPGAGSPRRQDWAAPGAVRVAVWQPELATPGKAQPTAVSEHSLLGAATPPPQLQAEISPLSSFCAVDAVNGAVQFLPASKSAWSGKCSAHILLTPRAVKVMLNLGERPLALFGDCQLCNFSIRTCALVSLNRRCPMQMLLHRLRPRLEA